MRKQKQGNVLLFVRPEPQIQLPPLNRGTIVGQDYPTIRRIFERLIRIRYTSLKRFLVPLMALDLNRMPEEMQQVLRDWLEAEEREIEYLLKMIGCQTEPSGKGVEGDEEEKSR